MPITQQRVIDLISAARAYQTEVARLRELVTSAHAGALASNDWRSALEVLALEIRHEPMRAEAQLAQLIAEEAMHFRLRRRKNELAQASAQRRRRRMGI